MIPNLFLAGFPKCGTTALAILLQQNDYIYTPRVKEPRYFLFRDSPPDKYDLVNSNVIWKRDDYLSLYSSSAHTFRIDASPGYAADLYAMLAINEMSPDAKIILLVRDPVERAYSHFLFAMRKGYEPNNITFEDVLSGKPRIVGNYLREVDYLYGSRYSIHIENILNIYSRDRIFIASAEDLNKSPDVVLRKLHQFLNIPYCDYNYNIGKQASSGIVKSRTFLFVSRLAKKLGKQMPVKHGKEIIQQVEGFMLSRALEKPAMSNKTKKLLKNQLQDEYEYVNSIGVDVSKWRNY